MEIKQVNKKDLLKKTNLFFHSQQWKNILVFFVFVVLAFSFWIIQYFQQTMEREITIPLTYENIPGEIILSDSIPTEITMRVSDKGTVLLKYFYNKRYMSIDIDLKDIPLNKNSYTLDRTRLNYEISDLLSNSTQLISYKPERIQIAYAPLEKKELPIRIDGKMNPAPGFIFIDTIHINPSKIWVYGNKSTLDTLTYIQTENINKENINKPVNFNVKLNSPPGVTLSEKQVNISSGIEEYTEKVFELPVICYGIPESTNVRFFPSTVEVTCRMALSLYSQLEEDDLIISTDYQTLVDNPGNNISINLTHKPEWLISYKLTPSTVEFLIEKN